MASANATAYCAVIGALAPACLLWFYPGEDREVTNRSPADRRGSASQSERDQPFVDVPPSIGPVVFGTLGVGWVMVRCPQQYDELMRRAGGVWEPGARQWLVERRRIGPVIRELERIVDPLFRRVGIHLDG